MAGDSPGGGAIALGTDGKLRVLADLLAQHYPQPLLIFTADNATVYRVSQDFLIPAITHQTPVKERQAILQHFRGGTYRCLVTSHVLDEGVDVPEAQVAILLSGSGSSREFIQRLGRILRRGTSPDKHAILYEVIAEETSEERTSKQRRSGYGPASRSRLTQEQLGRAADQPTDYQISLEWPNTDAGSEEF